ncbi:MAG: hypothetical protein E7269_02045 [Lachnospiraceae bacterium]|nr:hypothetical protein [Lachnospiraceae bacterium]
MIDLMFYANKHGEEISMNCREFQLLMKDFVFHEIKDEDALADAIAHIKSCKSCYEELELYYILNVGLEEIERDEVNTYDFKGQLDEIIGKYCFDLRLCRVVKGVNHCATVCAFWILSAFLLLQFLLWFVNI